MKILMISSYLPYPLYSGGQVRLYNLIKELSDKHEITLVCERRANQTDEDVKAVEKICKKVITVPRKKQWSVQNVLKAGTSSHSFLVTGHTLPQMQTAIAKLLGDETFDLIHVETFYVIQNVPDTKIPIVLVEHNIEYNVYERFLERAPKAVRPFLRIDINKIKKEEKASWKRADVLVAVSADDRKVMEQAGFAPSVVSNGVNTEQFAFKDIKKAVSEKEKKILFIGDFKWIQNKDSATFIIKEIWPEINSKLKTENVKLWIVARSIPESIRSLTNDTNVIFDEENSAKPTQEIFQEAAVLLAPIRVGGGTSYKILESMSCGTPVVTMKLSANALEVRDGEHLLVGQTAQELSEKVIKLLNDKELYQRVSKVGRSFVEENYTWRKIAKKLEAVYSSISVKR